MVNLIYAAPFAAIVFVLHFVLGVCFYYILRLFALRSIADSWIYSCTRIVSSFVLWLLGVRLNVKIDEESRKLLDSGKPVCFVSNHTSLLDIPAAICTIKTKVGFIAKVEAKYIPLINLMTFAVNGIFLDRSSMRNGVEGIRRGVKKIKDGISMLIFPEGTRSKTGVIAKFKPGAFRLASESDVPVLPIVVKGLRPALETREKMFKRYNAQIRILSPVYISMTEDRFERSQKIELIENSIRETYASLGDKNVI